MSSQSPPSAAVTLKVPSDQALFAMREETTTSQSDSSVPAPLPPAAFRAYVWNLVFLATSWALGWVVHFIHVSSSVVIAKQLASSDDLAIVPVGLVSLGTIIATFPLSILGDRRGYRTAFLVGAAFGLVGGAFSFLALYLHSFGLLFLALLLEGVFMGGVGILRFTAKLLSPPQYVSRSLSIVVGGAAVGAVIGPNIAKYTEWVIPSVQYGGAYVSILILVALQMVTICLIRFPARRVNVDEVTVESVEGAEQSADGSFVTAAPLESRSTTVGRMMKNTEFQIALIAGIASYLTMTLFMSPVPRYLIERAGPHRMIFSGLALLLLGAALLLIKTTLPFYFTGETSIGIGWNFAYITSSSLVAKMCSNQYQLATMQGVNDTLIAFSSAVFTIASGAMFRGIGWGGLLWFGVGVVVVTVGVLGVLVWRKGREVKMQGVESGGV
ncbi:hypothetical protein HDV00_008026 [Rhizophlyctis rosea]|nr:hypothetical protein HDV00_008026 [Rhizophlyctis rosea]